MKQNSFIREVLGNLNLSTEDKKMIEDICFAIQSRDPVMKNTIPNLLLISPDGTGTTTLGKEIAKEMEENYFFKTYGKETFLELLLPKPENISDTTMLDKFFASPRIAAGTQNKFYGLFLIDLSAWDGKDLMTHQVAVWERVINFIKNNKRNIYFCFRVKPDFEEKEKLLAELKKYLSIRTIELKHLGYSQIEQCICECMEKDGLVLQETSKEELHRLLEETSLLEREDLLGYHSIEVFIRELEYQLLIEVEKDSEDIKKIGQRVITKKHMQQAMNMFFPKQEIKTNKRNFGFC